MIRSILVVEDDEILRSQLARMLGARGLEVTEASGIEACKKQLAHLPPQDAALLDLNLNDDNGLQLIEPVLAHSPACRILVLTGYASIPTAVTATRLGAHNYLTKPAGIDQILHALEGETDDHLPALPEAPPSLERLEWEHIQRVLDDNDGNISAAARVLGIHRRTLQRRLKKRPSAADFHRDRESPGRH